MSEVQSIFATLYASFGGHDIAPSQMRALSAVTPALLLLAYIGLGLVYFRVSGAHRRFEDAEAAERTTGLSTRGGRLFFSWLMRPWLRLLLRSQLPASAITSVSLGFSLAAGVALAAGHFSVGGWLYLTAGACDFFDGRVARARGDASARGAALDSIIDRYAETAVLTGLAWYYRDSWVLVLALLALSGSLLVPYARAKAESLGMRLQDVGWLQRPERVILLGTVTALAPLLSLVLEPGAPRPLFGLTVVGLGILGVGTQITAAQRTRKLLSLLEGPGAPRPRPVKTIRALISSFVATVSDGALVFALVALIGSHWLPVVTGLGCLLGAVVNFSLNRSWAFKARDGSVFGQAWRYALASITSAVLNAGGVAVVGLLPGVEPGLAWLLVRGTVFGVWTLPLYHSYVFAVEAEPTVHATSVDVLSRAARH